MTKKNKKTKLKKGRSIFTKNTIRLVDFETRIKSLEEKTGIGDSTILEDSEKMKELKNSMLENKNEILQKLTESNNNKNKRTIQKRFILWWKIILSKFRRYRIIKRRYIKKEKIRRFKTFI